jgi:hypothetical protein
MTGIMPAPTYVLARAAWIPILVIWHADGRFTRLEVDPCAEYATALAAACRGRYSGSRPSPAGGSPRAARSRVSIV